MSKAINFNNLKKRYLSVTLPDEKQTVLLVTTPKKEVLDYLIAMKDNLSDDDMDESVLDEMYDICAKILSRNKTGHTITKNEVEDLFDFEDVIIFIKAYTDFIGEITSSKN